MRVYLDAKILFSAAKSDGAVRELLARLVRGGHLLVADAYVVEEARRNLARKGPSALAMLEQLLGDVELALVRQLELPTRVAALLPEKDRPVLAAADRLGCDVLLTGDRTHFGELYGKRVLGLVVHSPRSLAEALGL